MLIITEQLSFMVLKTISNLVFIQANPEIKKNHLTRCISSFRVWETLTMYDLHLKITCLYKASHRKVVYIVVQSMRSGARAGLEFRFLMLFY